MDVPTVNSSVSTGLSKSRVPHSLHAQPLVSPPSRNIRTPRICDVYEHANSEHLLPRARSTCLKSMLDGRRCGASLRRNPASTPADVETLGKDGTRIYPDMHQAYPQACGCTAILAVWTSRYCKQMCTGSVISFPWMPSAGWASDWHRRLCTSLTSHIRSMISRFHHCQVDGPALS